jgi:ankyrin repeat/BTB/POZ domain-containing protein 1
MEEMMDENRQISEDAGNDAETDGNVVNDDKIPQESMESIYGANIRTLDGEVVGDEFDSDSINYQILLEKIDKLLERLKLDA